MKVSKCYKNILVKKSKGCFIKCFKTKKMSLKNTFLSYTSLRFPLSKNNEEKKNPF